MLLRLVVLLNALAWGVCITAQAGAQPPSAEPGSPLCRDIDRLVEAADDGFSPFIARLMPGLEQAEVLTYEAVPIAGFELALAWQTGRRTDAGKPLASIYNARLFLDCSMAMSNHVREFERQVGRCLKQEPRPVVENLVLNAHYRAGETEIAVRHAWAGARGVCGWVSLRIGYPKLEPWELQ